MEKLNILKSFSILFSILSGILCFSLGHATANEIEVVLNRGFSTNSEYQGSLIFVHGRENGCGMRGHNNSGNCMNHNKGMGHRRRHGMGQERLSDAQCPQPRSTATAPEALYNKTNPIEKTADNIERGRLLFQLDAQPSCTACHGSGDGLGMMSGGLNPPPRNFTCKETMNSISDGQLFWIIKNGSPNTAMPPFENLENKEIWQLVHYIRQLSQ